MLAGAGIAGHRVPGSQDLDSLSHVWASRTDGQPASPEGDGVEPAGTAVPAKLSLRSPASSFRSAGSASRNPLRLQGSS